MSILIVIPLYYVLRTSIYSISRKVFILQTCTCRRYPAVTITDAVYADDLALFADSGKDGEILLQALAKSAKISGMHIYIYIY